MMDNWTKEFLAFCDSVNQEIESFFAEMEELPQLINEAIVEMEETLTEELELFSQDCEELFTFLVTEIDETEEEESDSEFVVTSKVYPDQNTHPACQGCRHYHGYVYGGNLFVCGMHPYGWDDENCPDWEQ
ncbi:hypothetical protein [Dactylococcopsis salina]|nr:hypothetical protein [Dactylococcopsis salina]